MSDDAVLALRGVHVRLAGTRVLDGLDLAVPAGCVYALLGGNGAGKTTTLNTLLGFVRPDAGEVWVDGIAAHARPAEARARLTYLPENVALYPYLSGVENLRYFCALADACCSADGARAALADAGLPPAAHDRRVEGYSKGMRQKVGLAIAGARNAAALLLDEPTSGLDPDASHELVHRLRRAADGGLAVLMVTHDLHNARQAADRIGILRRGRQVAEFDAASLDAAGLERLYLAEARAAA